MRRVFALVVDYDLWWKQGSATSAPAIDGDASTHSFGSIIGKTLRNIDVANHRGSMNGVAVGIAMCLDISCC